VTIATVNSSFQEAEFARDFQHGVQGEHGRRLHYVIGGQGDPILLVAGWPQSWYAWRKVIPSLAQRFTVVAVDPPGLGDSDKPNIGYDTLSVAARLHELVAALGWDCFHFVGHDIGCWIGYPYTATYPSHVRKLVLIDAMVPGITPNEAYAFLPDRIHKNWHFFFNALPDLPEALVTGRERDWLCWLFKTKSANPAAIDPAAIDEYVRCYAAPGGLRGGFGYYRALFESIAQNHELARQRIQTSVLTIGGDGGIGEGLGQMMRMVADDVNALVVPHCGHYIPEEAPDFLVEHLLAFLTERVA
jgi:pimeloyl-ACP methyl ester carboxylesterase